jgi:hypothetical protein
MSDLLGTPLLDHEVTEDERAWMNSVYEDFEAVRASFSGRKREFNPKEALREVLGREAHILPTPMSLSGPGPWPNGRNRQGRLVAAVFCGKSSCIYTLEAERTSFRCI